MNLLLALPKLLRRLRWPFGKDNATKHTTASGHGERGHSSKQGSRLFAVRWGFSSAPEVPGLDKNHIVSRISVSVASRSTCCSSFWPITRDAYFAMLKALIGQSHLAHRPLMLAHQDCSLGRYIGNGRIPACLALKIETNVKPGCLPKFGAAFAYS